MSTIIIRFPDGTREYRYSGRDVEQGDVIWHDGEEWTVLAVVTNDGGPQTATVEPNADGLKDKLQSEKGATNSARSTSYWPELGLAPSRLGTTHEGWTACSNK